MTSIHYINLNQSGGTSNQNMPLTTVEANEAVEKLNYYRARPAREAFAELYQQLENAYKENQRKLNQLNESIRSQNETNKTLLGDKDKIILQRNNLISKMRQADLLQRKLIKIQMEKEKLLKDNMFYFAQANREKVQQKIPGAIPAKDCKGKMVYHVSIPNLLTSENTQIVPIKPKQQPNQLLLSDNGIKLKQSMQQQPNNTQIVPYKYN